MEHVFLIDFFNQITRKKTVSGTGNCHFFAKPRLHAGAQTHRFLIILYLIKQYLEVKFVAFIFCPIRKITYPWFDGFDPTKYRKPRSELSSQLICTLSRN